MRSQESADEQDQRVETFVPKKKEFCNIYMFSYNISAISYLFLQVAYSSKTF